MKRKTNLITKARLMHVISYLQKEGFRIYRMPVVGGVWIMPPKRKQ